MKKIYVVVGLLAVLLGGCAQNSMVAPPSVVAAKPWGKAQALVGAVQKDLAARGVRSIQSHVVELENVLAASGQSYAAAPPGGETGYVLADGPAETLAAALLVVTQSKAAEGKVVVEKNPFPTVALMLGSYYNEIGRPADALRVLDTGLALPGAIPGEALGSHRPSLVSERGIALFKMKRLSEALAAYESGLTLPGLTDMDRARMLRGRGVSLIELGRLDEAVLAFQDSLKAEPKNPLALNELGYIAELRRGRAPVSPQFIAPNQAGPAGR